MLQGTVKAAGQRGGGRGLPGALSPPRHSAATRQRSSHNALGRIKGASCPVPLPACPASPLGQSWPEDI